MILDQKLPTAKIPTNIIIKTKCEKLVTEENKTLALFSDIWALGAAC